MENMENMENPSETGGKTGKPPRRDRVARCACTNEWTARNGNEEKPSRCPVCGSRNVKWRDECTGEELGKTGKPPENMENQFSSVENGGGKVEKPLENVEKQIFNSVTGDTYPIKAKSSKIADRETTGKTPPESTGENLTLDDIQKNYKGIPIFPFIWMLGLLGAAGLIWFLLGRRKKHVPAYPEPEQIRRPEGRAEAMMRQKLGGF